MMLIGSLALCGIFPFAGFYSKDLIIEASYVFYPAFIATILKNKTEQVGELYDSVSADAQDKEDVKKPGQIMQQRKT